jgi:putative N6-adenine-specific DNA methylase
MERTFRAFALCALGLEKVLSAEIERLGLKATGRAPGRAYFDADSAGLFRANLCLRTAERVLIEAARFRAPDFDLLFEGVKDREWELFIGRQDKLVIERVRIRDSALSAQTSVQSVVHKAIYERLCSTYGFDRMPETGVERSARVYLENNEVLIGLDTSGDALHRRGYRRSTVEAPMKETLAAATLLLSGWNRRIPLMDIFCGSGTFLIEAALFGLDMAPGLGRSFAMEDMPFADEALFEAERAAAKARIRGDVELCLVGSDSDDGALAAARQNAKLAGVAEAIRFTRCRAEDVEPLEEKGYVISNPPWGSRVGTEEEAEELYRKIGALAPKFKGWGLGFVANRQDFGVFFGRRATAEHKMLNGSEEQWFHWFPPGYEDTKPRQPPMASAPPRDKDGEGGAARGKPRRRAESKVAGERPHAPRSGGSEWPRREGASAREGFARRTGGEGERRPASGGYDRKPAGGGYERRPASGGYDRKPAGGGYEHRPSSGGYDRKPAGGGYDRRPASGGYDRKPAGGGYEHRPASGGYDRRPASGGYDRKPAGDGYEHRPASGGYDRKPAGGGYEHRPASGGYDRKPAGGGYEHRPASGGYDRKPAGGGYEHRPASGGYDRKPAGGGYDRRPQTDGDERRPSRSDSDTPPSPGFQRRMPSGGFHSRPASPGYDRGPSSGDGERRPSGGGYERRPPTGGYERRPPSGGYERRPPSGGYDRRPASGGYDRRPSSGGGPGGARQWPRREDGQGRRDSFNRGPARPSGDRPSPPPRPREDTDD